MGLPRGTNALLVALLLLLAIGLAVLATLQYRWIDRVTEAERQQMKANLDFAARRFTDDLRAELNQLFDAFGEPDRGDLAQRYEEWSRSAQHRSLLDAVYVAEPGGLKRFDVDTRQFVDASWPPSLEPVRRHLQEHRGAAGFSPPNEEPGGLKPAAPRERWRGPFLSEVPAFFYPPRPPRREFEPEGRPQGGGYPVIVVLSRNGLTKDILPALADRYFSTARKNEYDLALMNGGDLFYRTNASWPDGKTPADLEHEFVPLDRRGMRTRRPEIPIPEPIPAWRLLVHRHDGSLNTIVASTRNRNLAVSFAILFILGATAGVLAALLRRADRLRAQQTHFVAAMSHELNTPIAALRSAGENLKDGIVADREKLARYGETIVKEAARLGDMVGQVLEFAGMQARSRPLPLQPVDVASVIHEAIAQCQWILNGTKIDIEANVDDELPPVRGDAQALTRAIQNLIANAIRHGGSGQWVGVRATRETDGVTITVEDRGPGVDGREAARLFEPFYRGRGSGGTRGAGLGLAIVRQIAIAHGGSVDIDRKKRGGAAFAFHLPAAVEHA
ncbi:MAG TPA: HAMP domain-containing sensor histidine kinase [Thermoanaerobaculia bacterium]|nr:HAMP domain-containing sensor histidine kinase [Thermoanaerobaculia bacterium]